jgi:hypothetical protein
MSSVEKRRLLRVCIVTAPITTGTNWRNMWPGNTEKSSL